MKRLSVILKSVLFLLAIIVTSAGCDVQYGRFVTTSDTSYPLLYPLGSIDIVDGYERKADLVNDQPLLYVLIISSASQANGSGGGSDYGKYVTTLSHTWKTDKGILRVSISWDRQADVVAIGTQKFNRSNGNVFVVHLDTNGEISGQQLPSIDSHSNCQKVLQYIQEKLPSDKLISSIQLYK